MLKDMFKVMRCWKADNRAYYRQHDLLYVFPKIKEESGGDLAIFVSKTTLHICDDPAWKNTDEWKDTDHNPMAWWLRNRNA